MVNFTIKGSSNSIYTVKFIKGEDLFAYCTCKGRQISNTACKHILDIIDGDVTNIISNNHDDIQRVHDMMKGTEFELDYFDYKKALYSGNKRKIIKFKKRIVNPNNQEFLEQNQNKEYKNSSGCIISIFALILLFILYIIIF